MVPLFFFFVLYIYIFFFFIKVTVLLSEERRENRALRLRRSSATARIEIIRLLLTAAPPVDSVFQGFVLTQTPREATRCTPLCKINSCHQGIRVTICFVCFFFPPRERNNTANQKSVYWAAYEERWKWRTTLCFLSERIVKKKK